LASKLRRERVARQVVTGSVAPYVEPPNGKGMREQFGESLLPEWLGKQIGERVAQSLVKSLGESLEELVPI
jgi:hypothetical protein